MALQSGKEQFAGFSIDFFTIAGFNHPELARNYYKEIISMLKTPNTIILQKTLKLLVDINKNPPNLVQLALPKIKQ
ncbi:MAG: hypothetical protein ACFFD2_06835 [Promethearchaeota archaeon]